MAPRKSPSKMAPAAVSAADNELSKWLESEYALAANQRNTYCYLYNQAKSARMIGEPDSEKMTEWRLAAWKHETVMRFLAEKHKQLAYRVLQQSELPV
jgi:hypothetical protein